MDHTRLRELLRDVAPHKDEGPWDSGQTIGKYARASRPHRSTNLRGGGAPRPSAAPCYRGRSSTYEILEEIGRGGMGVVYRARQEGLSREVALKTIKKGKLEDHDADQAFLAEALVTGILEHPNIVPVYDLVETPEGDTAIAMKLVSGTSWFDLLHPSTQELQAKAAALSLEQHLRILISVCHGVSFAHNLGILHRDLKPSNVMVGSFGEVLVMDWGMAVTFRDVSEERATYVATRHCITRPSGSPGYMAPEMTVAKSDYIGPWTDVYLLGGVLYEILTGAKPHSGDSLYEVVKAAYVSKPPEFTGDVPAELQEICSKAMARKIRERFQTVDEFRASLESYLMHRQSLAITRAADVKLAEASAARASRGRASRVTYASLDEALSGYRQALVLWDGNERARSQERFARLAYAEAALSAEDFELARAQVGDLPGSEATSLAEKAREGALRRSRTQRTVKTLRVGVASLLGLVILGLGIGFFAVRAEKNRADKNAEAARQNAEAAESNRQIAERKAEEAREAALRVEKESRARIEALEQKHFEQWRADERAAQAREKALEADKLSGAVHEAASKADRDIAAARRELERSQTEVHTLKAEQAKLQGELASLRQTEHRMHAWSDAKLMELLESQAQKPFASAGARNDWLLSADGLLARESLHRESLEALRKRGLEGPDDELYLQTLTKLLSEMFRMRSAQGTLGRVRSSAPATNTGSAVSPSKKNPSDPKAKAAPAGLVPLGKDPTSGLEEFLHVASHRGPIPARQGQSRLIPSPEWGLVFVRIPRARFTMGSQGQDVRGQQYDPQAQSDESPVHSVDLDDFFVSKFEMTQGQWLRLMSSNPSLYGPGRSVGDHEHTLLHPVERLTWADCQRLREFNLDLPTEAQWEHAARGGTTTTWWFGSDSTGLAHRSNTADQSLLRTWKENTCESWTDGFAAHAPIGTFPPNPFGLHEVIGNVAEWCRDSHEPYGTSPAPRDGLRTGTSNDRVVRGGSFRNLSIHTRSAARWQRDANRPSGAVGVRPIFVPATPDSK